MEPFYIIITGSLKNGYKEATTSDVKLKHSGNISDEGVAVLLGGSMVDVIKDSKEKICIDDIIRYIKES